MLCQLASTRRRAHHANALCTLARWSTCALSQRGQTGQVGCSPFNLRLRRAWDEMEEDQIEAAKTMGYTEAAWCARTPQAPERPVLLVGFTLSPCHQLLVSHVLPTWRCELNAARPKNDKDGKWDDWDDLGDDVQEVC